jgi:ribosome-associated toxin RatA of RatAB toxin-antitoxin module
MFCEEYVSRVTVIPEQLRIETKSIVRQTDQQQQQQQHMFDSLRSTWQLKRVVLEEKGQQRQWQQGPGDEEEKGDDHTDHHKDKRDDTIATSFTSSSLSSSKGLYSNIACHVDFEVEMTVSDPLVVAVLDKILIQVAGHQVEAFEKRCKVIPYPMELIEQVERSLQRSAEDTTKQ